MVESDFGGVLTEEEVNRRELLKAYHEFTSFNTSSNDSDSFRESKMCLKLGSKWNLPIFEVKILRNCFILDRNIYVYMQGTRKNLEKTFTATNLFESLWYYCFNIVFFCIFCNNILALI